MSFAVAILVGATVLAGQTDEISPATPRFEVASVRENRSGQFRMALTNAPGGHFIATNVPLSMLIQFAYEVGPANILNKPGWLDSARYDIDAKVSVDAPGAGVMATKEITVRLRALLHDRFELGVKADARGDEGYAMLRVRPDVLGPGLKVSSKKCIETGLEKTQLSLPGPSAPDPGTASSGCDLKVDSGQLIASAQTMSDLSRALRMILKAPVVDRTGLEGNYDFRLQWSRDELDSASTSPTAPSVFTAVQEQLGLRLQRERISQPTIFVENVARPQDD